MRLKVISGELEVELVEGSLNIDEIHKLLRKQAETEDEESKTTIKQAPNKWTGKLGVKPKMTI